MRKVFATVNPIRRLLRLPPRIELPNPSELSAAIVGRLKVAGAL
jgi:hypothetical protein